MDMSKNKEIILAAAAAITKNLDQKHVGIIGFKDRTYVDSDKLKNQPNDIGSGVCIKIIDKYFVATAAHVINDYEINELALVYTKTPCNQMPEIITKGSNVGRPLDSIDVGYLEIAPDFAQKMGKDFIDLSLVETRPTLSEPKLCILYGYPTKLTNKELLTVNGIALQPICYVTSTKPITEVKNTEQPPNQHNDIFLDYPKEAEILNKGIVQNIPDAPGISGGGIWSITDTPNESIWTPESYKLIAIDRSWDPIVDG